MKREVSPCKNAIFSQSKSRISLALSPSHLLSPWIRIYSIHKTEKTTEKKYYLNIPPAATGVNRIRDRQTWEIFTCAINWRQVTVGRGCRPTLGATHVQNYGSFFIRFALRWQFWLREAIFPSVLRRDVTSCVTNVCIISYSPYWQLINKMSSSGKIVNRREFQIIFAKILPLSTFFFIFIRETLYAWNGRLAVCL